VLFSHGSNAVFLVHDSRTTIEGNGNSIDDEVTYDAIENDYNYAASAAAHACGVYISQLIRYSRSCGPYQNVLDGGLLLTRKLLNQGFLLVKLKSSFRKFYGRHNVNDLVDRYGIYVSQMTTDMFHLS
jgi:hypothetical protein